MPQVVNGIPQAASIMLGERGAQFIRQDNEDESSSEELLDEQIQLQFETPVPCNDSLIQEEPFELQVGSTQIPSVQTADANHVTLPSTQSPSPPGLFNVTVSAATLAPQINTTLSFVPTTHGGSQNGSFPFPTTSTLITQSNITVSTASQYTGPVVAAGGVPGEVPLELQLASTQSPNSLSGVTTSIIIIVILNKNTTI